MDIDWISISPQNGAAGQNPVAFQLVAENETFEDKRLTVRAVCGDKYKDLTLVLKGKTYPIGTVWNFDYTGGVQQITLPKGKYKLQCWGAQGGTSYGSSNGVGSKGGYSEGVITITETTTFYVFVGGKGSRGSSTSLVNGGWNGGGASVGYSSYSSGGTDGESYPACGGGATDISTITSSMSYSGGRTNRSAASLLARCIVAGGGAGGSYRYTVAETTTTEEQSIRSLTLKYGSTGSDGRLWFAGNPSLSGFSSGDVLKIVFDDTPYTKQIRIRDNNSTVIGTYTSNTITLPSSSNGLYYATIDVSYKSTSGLTSSSTPKYTMYKVVTTTSSSTSNGYSNKSQQGGGTSGKGQYPGTQTSAGSGGAFGLGASQSYTNYRYCAGGGGGGWYGGGTGNSDSSTNYVNYSGGGSGFVNTAANAASRPSGYTGLQLDSGTTKDGSTSFESTSGGTETGHSGNGYARITVLSQ